MENPDLEWERTQIITAACTLSGYFSEATIRLIADLYAPRQVERATVSGIVDEYISWHGDNKKQWPNPVDCNRMDEAYETLSRQGVLGIHWCQDTISSGHDYATELASSMGFRGYCFFHEQDVMAAIRGDGLQLAYDATEVDRSRALNIGEIVAKAMSSTGLIVSWSGSLADRIDLSGFAWGRTYKANLEPFVLQTSSLLER